MLVAERIHIARMRLAALILSMMFSASLCLVCTHCAKCSDPLCEDCEQMVENAPAVIETSLINESCALPVRLPLIAALPHGTSLVVSGIRLDD